MSHMAGASCDLQPGRPGETKVTRTPGGGLAPPFPEYEPGQRVRRHEPDMQQAVGGGRSDKGVEKIIAVKEGIRTEKEKDICEK
jgi:hypothetical protein